MKRLVSGLIRRWRHASSDERGVALFIAAGSMVALTSAVALAVDVGMLYTARTEAQRTADGAALAGAGALIESPGNAALATQLAMQFAGLNKVNGDAAVVLAEDVQVDTDENLVTVQVLRTEDRGTAIPTFFARIFGVNSVNVGVWATAEAAVAGGINCPLPVAVPDRWYEAGGAGNDPETFDPDRGDYYTPWFTGTYEDPVYNEAYTGYAQSDIGAPFVLTSNRPNSGLNVSWYYPWRPPENSGADDFRDGVRECADPSQAYYVGMEVDAEPGNMSGPTMQGFQDLIDSDPNATWNPSLKCIVDRGLQYSADAANCRQSSRVRPIPMFDPTIGPDLGAKPFTFTNFAGIFVESIQGKDVNARWVGYTGIKPAPPDEKRTAGPLFKALRLVK